MGYWEYAALSKQYHVPIVVGGFEPVDLIEAIGMLVAQLEEGRAEAENQYVRSVTLEGNRIAQKVLLDVFEVTDRKWRGIGAIPQSGLRLRPEFAEYDAERIFGLADATVEEPAECISALVLQGLKKPVDCRLSASAARPRARWERPWFRRKAPAPRIINTVVLP